MLGALLAGQGAVAALLLAIGWRWRAQRPVGRRLAACLAPAFVCLLLLSLAWLPGEQLPDRLQGMIVVLPFLVGAWIRLVTLPIPKANLSTPAQQGRNALWSLISASLHTGLMSAAAAWLSLWWISREPDLFGAFSGASWALTLLQLIAWLTGGLLLAAVIEGAMLAVSPPVPLDHDPRGFERLEAASRTTLLRLGWRTCALGLSIGVAMFADPIGPWYFWQSLWQNGEALLVLRLIVGLLLPALYMWTALVYLSEASPRAAIQAQVIGLVLVSLGEVLAAGLTFGLLGIPT